MGSIFIEAAKHATVDETVRTALPAEQHGIPGEGGGGVLNKVLYREALPRGPTPYPFTYHFGRKDTPFIYLLLKKRYPFHIPILGSLVLVFM